MKIKYDKEIQIYFIEHLDAQTGEIVKFGTQMGDRQKLIDYFIESLEQTNRLLVLENKKMFKNIQTLASSVGIENE